MKIRVVQIWGFLMTVLGWIFVACTMAMEGWRIASVGGMAGTSIIKVAWHWASLWRKCFTDSTSVSNCYDFGVLWSVHVPIQIVRGLLMGALSLGMLGFILSLLGMECTYIGGKEPSKHKKIFAGGLCHIISGVLSTCGYAVYAHDVLVENLEEEVTKLKYDLGTPLFLGWVGSAFHMAGGFFYLWSVCTPLCGGRGRASKKKTQPDLEKNKPTTASSASSEVTSNTKLSSISELSSKTERSDVSSLSSKSARTSKSGRTTRSGQSSMTGRTPRSARSSVYGSGSGSESQSGLSLESSRSTLLDSRSSSRSSNSSSRSSNSSSRSSQSSRTASSLSDSARSGATPFVQNSYI